MCNGLYIFFLVRKKATMRKSYTLFFNVRVSAIFFLVCCNVFSSLGQTVQIGNGTDIPAATLYSPVYRFSAGSTTTACRSNILFTASELSAAGITPGATITAIAFNKVNTAQFLIPAQYTVYMGNTSNTTLPTTTTWASILASHSQVYNNNSFNVQDAPGWNTWTLTTPFVYNG